jgi:serine/threonine protein phosphatase 1
VSLSKSNPECRYGKWEDIFIGHTPTQLYAARVPIHACNLWGLDTGAGWSGQLTLMDIDTHEYWQSDPTPVLYPDIRGRR